MVDDPQTGTWLLTIGTWFHTDGYGSGSEDHLLTRYLNVGPNRVSREVEGFFVIIVGDPRTREVIVITDVMGSCHCFARSSKLATALSGSSLLLAGLNNFTLDPVACQEFLYTGTMFEDRTFYREVRKLDPATVFRFGNGALQAQQRYWRITDLTPESLDGQPAVRALAETLSNAAHRVGRLFERPVCDMTGGYDSRALVAAFLTAGVRFTTTVSGPAESPDVVVSQALAQVAALPHIHLVAPEAVSPKQVMDTVPYTDGEFEPLEYARILYVHGTLSQSFDISINGSFGGIARALWWELLFPRIGACSKLDAHRLARLRYATHTFDASLFSPDRRLDLISHFTDVIERANAGLSKLPNTMQMDHANLSMRIHRWQGRIASSTNQLWPCLSPFGLRSVLEVVLQTKAHLRLRSLLVRQVLAQYQPRLAEFPLDRGYPAVPVTWKNLHRFWPIPVYFGKRILSKGIRMLGSDRTSRGSPSDPSSPRLRLWQQEEVRELLKASTMQLTCLLRPAALADFLGRSQQTHFPFDSQWARLLTLEYTLRALASSHTSPVNGHSPIHTAALVRPGAANCM